MDLDYDCPMLFVTTSTQNYVMKTNFSDRIIITQNEEISLDFITRICIEMELFAWDTGFI